MAAFPTITTTNNGDAQSALISAAAANGLNIAPLSVEGQLQLAVANTIRALLSAGDPGTSGPFTVTSASASALAVGLAGATNPAFVVDASTASQAAGLKVTGATAAGTVALAAISSGAAANLTINAKGVGTIGIGSASTGAVTITPATTHSGAVTINAATQLGTAAGADVTTIGGTDYGAGVASVRLNGLTTAAVANQVGTMTNAPSAGNPVFWIPVNIAGSVRYIPAWA